MTPEPKELEMQGKTAFRNGRFADAANLFRLAAENYTLGHDGLMAAEMMNNVSVALLKAGKSQESLDAALDTDKIFADANDTKRQAMALGNQGSALEALHRYEEALEKYDQAAELFEKVNEDDLRSVVKKSASGVRLKMGKVTESAFGVLGALEAKKSPSFLERILKSFLDFVFRR